MTETKAIAKYESPIMEARRGFTTIIPDEQVWLKEREFALQTIRGNTSLQTCTFDSIKDAIINVALTGLSLNPALKRAYLVPRDGKAVLDISYQGLIYLATSSGDIKKIGAQVVYDWDEFTFEHGTEEKIVHKPNMDPPTDKMDLIKKDAQAIWNHIVCAYSIATLNDGSRDFVVLPTWKLWKVRQSSKAIKSPDTPWNKWPEEMIRKTVIKYHSKTLPSSDRLAEAVSILNEHEGLDPDLVKNERITHAKDTEARLGFTPEKEVPDAVIEPICVCAEMKKDFDTWDCPVHGRMSK
uniref:Putative DNA recombination protein n=1 Tax=viral metagenome TaxID=1070528 RepID=A0A6H1ZPB4_9ZZZZ